MSAPCGPRGRAFSEGELGVAQAASTPAGAGIVGVADNAAAALLASPTVSWLADASCTAMGRCGVSACGVPGGLARMPSSIATPGLASAPAPVPALPLGPRRGGVGDDVERGVPPPSAHDALDTMAAPLRSGGVGVAAWAISRRRTSRSREAPPSRSLGRAAGACRRGMAPGRARGLSRRGSLGRSMLRAERLEMCEGAAKQARGV